MRCKEVYLYFVTMKNLYRLVLLEAAMENWSQASAKEASNYLWSQIQIKVQQFVFSVGKQGAGKKKEDLHKSH